MWAGPLSVQGSAGHEALLLLTPPVTNRHYFAYYRHIDTGDVQLLITFIIPVVVVLGRVGTLPERDRH